MDIFARSFSCPDPAENFPVWSAASLRGMQVDPFCCSPVWQLSFHDAFSPDRPLFIEECGESALAFAEIRFSNDDIFLTPLEAHWFFGSPLLGSHAPDMLRRMMERLALYYAPHFPRIMIGGIRPEGAISRDLFRLFAKDFNFYLHSSGVQCAASLKGGVDGYLARRSANHRAKLRKARRRAMDKGLYFERACPRTYAQADELFARMLAVERTSWKGIGRCGMAEDIVKDFYAVLLRRLALHGDGRVIFARYENADVGFIFGAMAGRVYRGQQFSFDDNWRAFCVGNILQLEQVAWLCEEGAERYDMGPLKGPRMGYKEHWTEMAEPIVTLLLQRK